MTQSATPEAFAALTEPATLRLERLLPGSIDRVWAFLTESDLRRQWMAEGVMDMRVGGTANLVWRNNELTDPPGNKPDGFGEEHRMEGEGRPPRPRRRHVRDHRLQDRGGRRGAQVPGPRVRRDVATRWRSEPVRAPGGSARSRVRDSARRRHPAKRVGDRRTRSCVAGAPRSGGCIAG